MTSALRTHADPAPREAGRPRLLVVDDVADNRTLLNRLFSRSGYDIVETHSGADALRLVAEEPFDLVLLDVMMPGMDGLEVLRRIRGEGPDPALPVIMVTALTEGADVAKALRMGADDYVTKPVDAVQTLARVETQLRRRAAEARTWRENAKLDSLNRELERRVAKADALGRAKSEFLANMSHEIRTPLNGVCTIAQLLAGTELAPQQKEMVSIITSSAASLERLVTDALDSAQQEAGGTSALTAPFDLAATVGDVARLWEAKARAKGLGFSWTAPAPDQVTGDPARLSQILNNLLNNAVKFTAAGAVSLRVEALDGGLYRFEVSDTGIGFDQQTAARLFQRFQQGDDTIRERFGGTGLGLAISRDLAEAMGGSLACRSEPGAGSVFTLELPLRAA